MLQISPQVITPELTEELNKSRAKLGMPPVNGDFTVLNREAQTDHRVEVSFMDMASLVNKLQNAKNVLYDNSYSKRGLFSIFFNMERKWQRMDNQLFKGLGDAASEGFLDTCVDLAAYSMKLCAWICARSPKAYLKLTQMVQAEVESNGTPRIAE